MKQPTTFAQALGRIRFHDSEIDSLTLAELLASIPRVDQPEVITPGSRVLIRLDVDVPIVDGTVAERVRLESGSRTLEFCLSRQCKAVVFGHLGREASASLRPVANALSDILNCDVLFAEDWFDPATNLVTSETIDTIARMAPSSVLLLENCRKYAIERTLWKASPESLVEVAPTLSRAARSIRKHLAALEINEAIAASNADFSSSVVPLTMDRAALGFFIHEELATHATRAQAANLVVFSGLKIDKLDDLESVVARSSLRTLIAAGSLAMALKKAEAKLAGREFSIGLAESDPKNKAYISEDRVGQATRILTACRQKGTAVVLPIDFTLDDGTVSTEIPQGRLQMDVGPNTTELIRNELHQYAEESLANSTPYVMFTNGVFGKFEEPRFEHGTREFVAMLRTISKSVQIYVGGGEGRASLEKYGSLSDVEHAFTAGGTILKCMGGKHIAPLKALWIQNATSGISIDESER